METGIEVKEMRRNQILLFLDINVIIYPRPNPDVGLANLSKLMSPWLHVAPYHEPSNF